VAEVLPPTACPATVPAPASMLPVPPVAIWVLVETVPVTVLLRFT
jgi:hypothetical protein